MARFLILHEASIPNQDLCSKYGVPTYEEYKSWARTEGRQQFLKGSVVTSPWNWNPKQSLAFSLISCLAITNNKPRYFVVNKDFVISYVSHFGTLITSFEEVPLAVDAEALATIAWLL